MDKLLCIQQPVRPLQEEIDYFSWQDEAVGDAVPADEVQVDLSRQDEAVEEAEPDDAVEVIGASEDERKEKHVEQIDDEKDDEKNKVEEVVGGEKDEEQIAEETDIKNTWSESEEDKKKKQAMRRSDELIKLQTKPTQLRSKQAAYEVDPEMDEGEKITRQLPAGAAGALKGLKDLQRGFPWKQKWNGKEAEAPPRKRWRPDDWWKKDANFQDGQEWRKKPEPPPQEVAAWAPRSAPAKQPRNIMVPPPPPKPPVPLPPTPPPVPRPAASGLARSSGSASMLTMPKGARPSPGDLLDEINGRLVGSTASGSGARKPPQEVASFAPFLTRGDVCKLRSDAREYVKLEIGLPSELPADLYKLIYAEDPPAGLSSDESMGMLQDVPLRKTNKMTRAPSSQLQLAQPQQVNVVQQMASTIMAAMRQMGNVGCGGGQPECDINMLQPKRRKHQKAIEDGQVQETPTPSPPAVTSPAETPTTKGPQTADEEAKSKPTPKISPKALFKDEEELDASGQAAIVEAAIEAQQMKRPAASNSVTDRKKNNPKEQQKTMKTKKQGKAEKPARSNYLKKWHNVKHKRAITNYAGQLCQFGHVDCSKEELFSIADKAIEQLNEGSLA
eukprot:symbB.v1.2.036228.t1/scaffold5065.1/size52819/2